MEKLFYSYFLPRISHKFSCVGCLDVLRYEAMGVDMLKVLEGLGWVAVEGLQGSSGLAVENLGIRSLFVAPSKESVDTGHSASRKEATTSLSR